MRTLSSMYFKMRMRILLQSILTFSTLCESYCNKFSLFVWLKNSAATATIPKHGGDYVTMDNPKAGSSTRDH